MAVLLLRLAAPLQSWGTDSKFETRRTNKEPSKSGVIGLLAAALGIRRDEPEKLIPLSRLRFGVRVVREGEMLLDYHIAKSKDTTYLTYRYYLNDAVFLVGLESEDEEFLKMLEDALLHPVFSLYLGRRSCPPTLPLVLGIRETDLLTALREETEFPEYEANKKEDFYIVMDAPAGEPSLAIQRDIPISFDSRHRKYADRAVKMYIENSKEKEEQQEHDVMAELEGYPCI